MSLTADYSLLQPECETPAQRPMETEAEMLRDAAADATAVYTFVAWMLVIGALALVAVQRRKRMSASIYDRRGKA